MPKKNAQKIEDSFIYIFVILLFSYNYTRLSQKENTRIKYKYTYFVLSRNAMRKPNTKLTHSILIDILLEYYPQSIYTTKTDYDRGFECLIETPDKRNIHFELNKYDKATGLRDQVIGQDRVKIKGYSKNGYLLTLPDDNKTNS